LCGRRNALNAVKKIESIGVWVALEFVVAHKHVYGNLSQQVKQLPDALTFEADLDVRTCRHDVLDPEQNKRVIVGNT
jgi:hypothetical protein